MTGHEVTAWLTERYPAEPANCLALLQQEPPQRQSSVSAKASVPDSDAQRQSHAVKKEEEEEEKADQQRSIEGEEEKEPVAEVQDVSDGRVSPTTVTTSAGKALFTLEDIESSPLLQISRLSEWDFPIFELAEQEKTFVLSKVSCCCWQLYRLCGGRGRGGGGGGQKRRCKSFACSF